MVRLNSQGKLFAKYKSLNLKDKIYQVKALDLAQELVGGRKNRIKLLDIGCADGSYAAYVGEKLKAETYGVDISAHAIKKAKTRLDQAVRGDVSKRLPFTDASFELIFVLEVIEHIYDTDYLLSEIRRVLKPCGVVIISTPNLASLQNRIRLAFNHYPQYLEYSTAGAGHIHLYTSKVLARQMKAHGLKLVKLTSANFLAPMITSLYAPQIYVRLMMKLGDCLPTLGSHLIAVGTK